MQGREFGIVSRGGIAWLECAGLARLPWLLHAFSTRRGGVSPAPARGLNLGFVEFGRRSNVEANRKSFLAAIEAGSFALAGLRQIHSSVVHPVLRGPRGEAQYGQSRRPSRQSPPGDALITNQPGILLSVRMADCLPLLLADPRHRAIAAIHAGWRGAHERIVEKTVGEMRRIFGTKPRDLLAALGPSIRACCYEVGEDVLSAYARAFPESGKFFIPEPPAPTGPRGWRNRARLDLVRVATAQLRAAGLPAGRVLVSGFCTACRADLFFSYRRDGNRTGRMMAVIGICPS